MCLDKLECTAYIELLFLSNHLFNQCELNICEIIASLTHFTFRESEKTTVFYVAFYSGRIPADS